MRFIFSLITAGVAVFSCLLILFILYKRSKERREYTRLIAELKLSYAWAPQRYLCVADVGDWFYFGYSDGWALFSLWLFKFHVLYVSFCCIASLYFSSTLKMTRGVIIAHSKLQVVPHIGPHDNSKSDRNMPASLVDGFNKGLIHSSSPYKSSCPFLSNSTSLLAHPACFFCIISSLESLNLWTQLNSETLELWRCILDQSFLTIFPVMQWV
jgi:hypothetical protein